jgi:beta-lactam-binding protein with PASTA domain
MGKVSMGDAQVPAATIYSQEPSPNSKVRAGTPVNIWVAQPTLSKPAVVPDLAHMNLGGAGTVLSQRHLRLGNVKEEESDLLAGFIVSQSPAPGTRVAPNSPVNVTVGKPPLLVTVPNLLHLDEASAASALESAGLRMGGVSEEDSHEGSGTVLAQIPAPNTQVRSGTEVNVTVSRQIEVLTLMVDDPNPEIGKPVNFHAHLEPGGNQYQYQFNFGDGSWTQWQSASVIGHRYRTAGSHEVQAAVSQAGNTVANAMIAVEAREAAFDLSLTTSSSVPKLDEDVTFTAHTNRADIHPAYQFVFADETTKWMSEASVIHRFTRRGSYPVLVRARVELGTVVESSPREVFVGAVPAFLWGGVLGTLVVACGVGGFRYHGLKQFHRFIRVETRTDAGRQRLTTDKQSGPDATVRVRTLCPPGDNRITMVHASDQRKAGNV